MTYEEKFPREDWQYDVANGDTQLGYADWVLHNAEAEDSDSIGEVMGYDEDIPSSNYVPSADEADDWEETEGWDDWTSLDTF